MLSTNNLVTSDLHESPQQSIPQVLSLVIAPPDEFKWIVLWLFLVPVADRNGSFHSRPRSLNCVSAGSSLRVNKLSLSLMADCLALAVVVPVLGDLVVCLLLVTDDNRTRSNKLPRERHSVAVSLFSTTQAKNLQLEAHLIPPNTQAPSTLCPWLCFLLPNLDSAISTTIPSPPATVTSLKTQVAIRSQMFLVHAVTFLLLHLSCLRWNPVVAPMSQLHRN